MNQTCHTFITARAFWGPVLKLDSREHQILTLKRPLKERSVL